MEWLLTELARKNDKVFSKVAKDCGFVTTATKRMDVYSTAAMFADANINSTQQRTILRHFFSYFGLRLVATEKELRELGEGYLVPLTGSIETEQKEKISYWYKLVDEHFNHEIGDLIGNDLSFPQNLSKVDIVVGGDHGKGRFRLVLMIFLRSKNGITRSRRFVIGEIKCKKDYSEILRKTFILQQNDALDNVASGKRFIIT